MGADQPKNNSTRMYSTLLAKKQAEGNEKEDSLLFCEAFAILRRRAVLLPKVTLRQSENLKLEWRELGSGKQRDGRHLSDVQKTINN